MHRPTPLAAYLRRFSVLAFAVLAILAIASACGSDNTGEGSSSCTYDMDCALGQVCSFAGQCVTASCDNCTAEQICYITPSNPEGSCSRPECLSPEDCAEGQTCTNGLCQSGCASAVDCPGDQICNLANQCVDPPQPSTCTNDNECESGEVCTNGACVPAPATSCEAVQCEANERCHPQTFACVRDCVSDPTLCDANQVCDATTGQCSANPCPGANPEACEGATPHFNTTLCACVGCVNNADCSGGQVCNSNGTCVTAGECAQPCDPNVPGTCGGGTPYCLDNCCSECVGAADCPQGLLCLNGFCGTPPDCTNDPSVCPAGYECQSGSCVPPQTGQNCDPQDPASCPVGTFCDPATSTCGGLGGELGCGLCNEDCTCPGSLTCDGFFCSGCQGSLINLQGGCPDGQFCLGGLCFPSPI